ncbi:MAG: response regulator [Deltaproteobacteria bacterium]|nr:response regulator [Deltaproteobacteria bacterium]
MRTDITVNSNIRLLLVDDEEDFRQTIAKRLKKRGFAPEEAGSGNECLALLENKAVDIVVLDVKMPGMDGIETLRHIKEKFPETEVILLTGHAVTSDGISGIKSGAFDYLSKPIEFEHLLSKIKQAYNKIIREEEKRKDAEFRASMEQQMIATERLASLGTLSAGVAHEINNPLAIINESVGWMRLILQKDELAEMPRKKDFEKALGKIEKGVDRARRITHQLLETVRKNNSVFTQVDLKEVAQEAVELLGQETKNRDIYFFYEMEESACTIWSDPYQLRQVLINLLTNAIHSMDTGGRITIILKAGVDDIILTIRDTGNGIPKENLDKIFEPFFSTKSPGKGTGLGLFVTRSIIDKLGGKVTVKSRLGHGTSFSITLPKYYEI